MYKNLKLYGLKNYMLMHINSNPLNPIHTQLDIENKIDQVWFWLLWIGVSSNSSWECSFAWFDFMLRM